jgi:hypothetical protein
MHVQYTLCIHTVSIHTWFQPYYGWLHQVPSPVNDPIRPRREWRQRLKKGRHWLARAASSLPRCPPHLTQDERILVLVTCPCSSKTDRQTYRWTDGTDACCNLSNNLINPINDNVGLEGKTNNYQALSKTRCTKGASTIHSSRESEEVTDQY